MHAHKYNASSINLSSLTHMQQGLSKHHEESRALPAQNANSPDRNAVRKLHMQETYWCRSKSFPVVIQQQPAAWQPGMSVSSPRPRAGGQASPIPVPVFLYTSVQKTWAVSDRKTSHEGRGKQMPTAFSIHRRHIVTVHIVVGVNDNCPTLYQGQSISISHQKHMIPYNR